MDLYDLIVIGGGMAGMTSALYALRNNKRVLMIEKESFGGQIANSPKVENFPSIPSISGLELSDKMFNQISEHGVEFELDTIVNISKENDIFHLDGEYGKYSAKSVIIASGLKHRKLNLPGEDEYIGSGVSYCAVCDGPFYKGEDVVLIGDGNTALQYALLLSLYCRKVTVCTMFDRFFGDEGHITALRKCDNVEVIHNVVSKEFITDGDKLAGVLFECREDKAIIKILCDGVFVAIGQVPDNGAFSSLADLDKAGYFISDESCTTKTAGLFVAGDCRTKNIRQLTTAVCDGAVSALNACNYLINNQDLWK